MWEFPWIFGFVTFRLLLVFAFFCIFCGSQNFLRIRYFDSVLIGTVKMYFASSGLRSTGCFLIVYDAAFVSRIINIKGFSVWSLLVLFPFGRSAGFLNTMRFSSPLLCIWLFIWCVPSGIYLYIGITSCDYKISQLFSLFNMEYYIKW